MNIDPNTSKETANQYIQQSVERIEQIDKELKVERRKAWRNGSQTKTIQRLGHERSRLDREITAFNLFLVRKQREAEAAQAPAPKKPYIVIYSDQDDYYNAWKRLRSMAELSGQGIRVHFTQAPPISGEKWTIFPCSSREAATASTQRVATEPRRYQ